MSVASDLREVSVASDLREVSVASDSPSILVGEIPRDRNYP